jgi:hypothetical protein
MLGYFLKPYARFGIKTGIQYQNMKGNIEKNGFNVRYMTTDIWDAPYQQHIYSTSNSVLKEQFNITQWSIPILLALKRNFGTKIGIQLDAGINCILQYYGKSTPDANNKFDYEAIYFSKDFNDFSDPIYEFNTNFEGNQNDFWYISRDRINVNDIANLSAQGYNVGLDQKVSKANNDINFNGKVGFLIKPTINYNISDVSGFSLGAILMMNQYSNQSNVGKYYLTKQVGEYNSILNSINNLNTTSITLTLGFYHAFNFKKSK